MNVICVRCNYSVKCIPLKDGNYKPSTWKFANEGASNVGWCPGCLHVMFYKFGLPSWLD